MAKFIFEWLLTVELRSNLNQKYYYFLLKVGATHSEVKKGYV